MHIKQIYIFNEVTHHLIASPNEDRDSTRVCAFFDYEHLVPCCTKGHFTDYTCLAKLFGR
jgi:hypothetical protein